MIVDKIWKLTNVVRVVHAPWSSHSLRQATFPDNVCSYLPPVTVCYYKILSDTGKNASYWKKEYGAKEKDGCWGQAFQDGSLGLWYCWTVYILLGGGFWTPPWLTWCGIKKHLKSSWKRSTKKTQTHTHTHTHTTYSLTDAPIHIHFPFCLTHQYITSVVTLVVPHTLP